MNTFSVKQIEVVGRKITYHYEVEGAWRKYFDLEHPYFIEYSVDVSSVPEGILVIPLINDILPVAWIFDAEIIVDVIDREYMECLPKVKQGFIEMYPSINFRGTITATRVETHSYSVTNRAGAFFSGGVDAVSTAVSHINEELLLMYIAGSDIDFSNDKLVAMAETRIKLTAERLGLQYIFIKSSFVDIIRRKFLERSYLTKRAKDTYWHGFQHGLAIIGHAAPIAYIYKLGKVYIASSYTKEDGKVCCGSDPTIDNYVKFASTSVVHDGYEMHRGEKIRNIDKYCKESNTQIELRVCFDEYNPGNCCSCEKCYRTIYEFLANRCDPKQYGFKIGDDFHKKAEHDFKTKIVLNDICAWKRIKQTIINNPYQTDEFAALQWIADFDFEKDKRNEFIRYFKILNRKRSTMMKKIYRHFQKFV